MKKIYSLLALLLIACQATIAGPVDQAQALKLAGNFLGTGTASSLKMKYKTSYKSRRANQQEQNLYYVINRGENQGYVVVAGDNRVMPILAYSETGNMTEEDIQNHPSLQYMFGEYENQMKWAIENVADTPSDEYKKIAARASSANYQIIVHPLLEVSNDRRTRLASPISWGQSWPFNLYSPNYRYNGTTYPTVSGCVATGISTVLRWHRWPNKAKGSVSYYWKRNYMSLNFDGNGSENAAYNWAQMPSGVDSYGRDRSTGRTLTGVQADNIGRLLRDVGYAVQMDYNPASFGGSGAYVYNAPRVLINNFGYRNTVRFLRRNNYYTAEWLRQVRDELESFGPIVYAGYSAGGGHCFVLDGYATNGYVHVDWGWNYSQNGWYLLDVLQPGREGIGGGSGGYRSNQEMLRYLYPDRGNDPDPEPNPNPNPNPDDEEEDTEDGSNLYVYSKSTDTNLQQKNYVPVTVTVGNKNSSADYSGRLAIAIYQEGDANSVIVGTTSAIVRAGSYKTVTFYTNLANIKSGTYNLTVNYAKGSSYKAIDAVAGTVRIGAAEPEPEPDPIVVKGVELYAAQKVYKNAVEGENDKIQVPITNEGDQDFSGKLMLYALTAGSKDVSAAKLISEGNATVDKGQSVSFSFYTNDEFKKLAVGSYDLIIGYMIDGEEIAVKVAADKETWKIGNLTITAKTDDENEEEDVPVVVNDIKLQTVFFYQDGNYLGTDNSTISTKSSKFTARVYLKSMTGFNGKVKFYVTDTQYGTKSLNSKMEVTKTVKLDANSNGYVDVPLYTNYFTKNRYYVNILYRTDGSKWMFYPTDVVPFYVNKAASYYYGEDGELTWGPTYEFNTLPVNNNSYQSIGYGELGGELNTGETTGISSVENGVLSVYPNVADNEITVTVNENCTSIIYDIQGKVIGKYALRDGDNVISLSSMCSGVYVIKVGTAVEKFIKR